MGAEGSPHSRGRGFSSQGEGPNPLDVNDSQSFDLGQRTPRDARDVDASLQHEETPTISTPAVDLESERDATVATSYLSRLGARLTPRNFSSEHSEERPGRHRAVRYRLQDRFNSLRGPRHGPRARDLSNSSLTSPTRAPSSERSDAATVSGPVPLSSQDSWSRRSISASTLALESETSTAPSSISTNVPGPSRNSRLSRVRDSLFLPIPNMIQNFANRTSRLGDSPGSSSRRQSRGILTENSEPFLPRHSPPAIGVDIDDTPLTPSLFTSASRPRRNRSISDPDVRSPSIERQARRLQNSLRRGPSRPQRGEDQAAMLSRLLSVAAAATAASLVGNTDRAFSEAHDVAGDGVDGSFDGFLQALQNGSLAAALRNGGNEMGGGSENSSGDGSFTPVNFFRMFRFGATNSDGGRSSGSTTPTDEGYEGSRSGSQQSTVEREGSETPSPRMVPVIIVGIRSVTPLEGITQGEGGTTTPPLFDALSNLPLTMPNGLPRGGPQGTLMRRTDRRSRFARSRRASMSAVNYDSQRHQRSTSGALQTLPDSRPLMSSALPTVLSDSPPGPHPPPSTPADYALSAFSSGTNTPSRRPSSAAGGPLLANPLPSWQENTQQSPNSTNASLNRGSSSSTPPVAAQRRRLSDGEFARHRDLGSGSSRRNGIVGDSDVSAGARRAANGTPTEGTRSWIIYVLGGSYPEDHPILTTPSLFTDVSHVCPLCPSNQEGLD